MTTRDNSTMGLRTPRSRQRVLIDGSFSSFILKQLQLFLYNYCYELTITGLLDIKFLGDLICNGRHLLQQLRILLVSVVGG
jgi:hypothetical protein